MGVSAAIKVQRYRARQETGRVVLAVEVDEVALVGALIEARMLDPGQADDRSAIAEATNHSPIKGQGIA